MRVALNAEARSKVHFKGLHSSKPQFKDCSGVRKHHGAQCSVNVNVQLPVGAGLSRSSYNNFWSVVQLLSKYSMNSLMDLSCQKRWSLMSLAHGLKLPDTRMLVYFFGETSCIWPPVSTDDSRVSSTIHALAKVRCHCASAFEFPARVQRGPVDDIVVGDLSSSRCFPSCADIMLKAFVIFFAVLAAPLVSFS